jgi:hypothetical protein
MKTTCISPAEFTLRSEFKPGDLGQIIHLHGIVFAREFGLDPTFEADVAGQIAESARTRGDGDRLWIAEKDGRFAGFMAVVSLSPRGCPVTLVLHPTIRSRIAIGGTNALGSDLVLCVLRV